MPKKVTIANVFMLFLLLYIIIISDALGFLLNAYPGLLAALLRTRLILVFQSVLFFLVPLVIAISIMHVLKYRYVTPTNPLGQTNIILIAAMSVCAQPIILLLSAVSSLVFQNDVPGLLSWLNELPLPAALAVIALTPAINEELVFRGFILTHYSEVGIKKAAVINGLFFGIVHLNAHQFLYAFAMGVFFAYLVHFTRSVYASMLSHFLVNGVQLLLSYIPVPEDSVVEAAASANVTDMASAIVSLTVLALIFTPVFVILFCTFVSHNRQRNAAHDLEALLSI